MANMSNERIPMPEQDPMVRNKNFSEVALGYTADMAMEEASRCLNCKTAPCVGACPVNVKIPEFLALAAEGKFVEAYEKIKETSALPAVCGRVCPQETQCESKCTRGIKGQPVSIGRIERFVADYAREQGVQDPIKEHNAANGCYRVAIVGSGPSGLTCAGDLVDMGYDVTVFEAFHIAGGVLMYGIPEFRLPKDIVQNEVESLKRKGVKFVLNYFVGRSGNVDDLLTEEGYDAVFVGAGAGLPQFLHIPGENFVGVYSANEYLTRINLMKAYKENAETPILRAKRVAVCGGGNVAMDAARSAMRMGAEEVSIVYRRGESELPARAEEVHHAKEEGVQFQLLTAPLEIVGNEKRHVTGLKCQKMELGEPDATGRRRPVAVPDSEFVLEAELVIVAIGTQPNPMILSTTKGLEAMKGCIMTIDESGQTSREAVFAGGDIVTGAATVIKAMGAGKRSAIAIDDYIQRLNQQNKIRKSPTKQPVGAV